MLPAKSTLSRSPYKIVVFPMLNVVNIKVILQHKKLGKNETNMYRRNLIAAPYWKRVFAISLLGCLACVSVSTIYWNWYEFPTDFFLAQCIDQIFGCFLAGLAIAKIVPPSTRKVYID
jgi:hypothetical protein